MTRPTLLCASLSLGVLLIMQTLAAPAWAQTAPASAPAAQMPTAQAPSAQATAIPGPTTLRLSLVGRWSGALGYRDYQTDQLQEIPVTTTIEALPDGVTQIRRSLFDDGPAKPVWITSISLDDPAAGTVTSASFRRGNAVEPETETMQVAAFADMTHWSIVYSTTATDGDGLAEIRVTETLDGDSLIAVKTVRPVGADDAAWRFRNQTRLARVRD